MGSPSKHFWPRRFNRSSSFKPCLCSFLKIKECSRRIIGEGVHGMGMNPCASESSWSQLPNAQGFISISLLVAPEYSFENVEILNFLKKSPEFTYVLHLGEIANVFYFEKHCAKL